MLDLKQLHLISQTY
jgi:hypothetical protein